MSTGAERRQIRGERTRTEQAASTVPSTWIALANEIVRSEREDKHLVTKRLNAAHTLAELILEAS